MNDATPLDEADSPRDWSVLAILAIVLGICSGPIMVALVWLTGIAYGIGTVGSGIVVIVGIAIVIFCIAAHIRARSRAIRGGNLALVGLAATILWSIGLIALYCDIDAHLN